ncbi:hypothetical protein BT69DRAFT_1334338 [Atractiella rhizophila]|nr:hypothetical protein BT69DRAFT_1334338 [Atractiella rhizophila]
MLHRDVPFGNILLGPIEDGLKGYLIDWEFAKKTSEPPTSRERTGTYEFMSRRLLDESSQRRMSPTSPKTTLSRSFTF